MTVAKTAEEAERQLLACVSDLQATMNQLAGEAGGAQVAEAKAREALEASSQSLPAGTIDQDLGSLRGELDSLERGTVESEFSEAGRGLRNFCEVDQQKRGSDPGDQRGFGA